MLAFCSSYLLPRLHSPQNQPIDARILLFLSAASLPQSAEPTDRCLHFAPPICRLTSTAINPTDSNAFHHIFYMSVLKYSHPTDLDFPCRHINLLPRRPMSKFIPRLRFLNTPRYTAIHRSTPRYSAINHNTPQYIPSYAPAVSLIFSWAFTNP